MLYAWLLILPTETEMCDRQFGNVLVVFEIKMSHLIWFVDVVDVACLFSHSVTYRLKSNFCLHA